MNKQPFVNIYKELSMGFIDYPTAEDHSINVYFYGCHHHCIQCSNPMFWSSKFGTRVSVKELFLLIHKSSKEFRTRKVCLLGGDPLYKKNIDFVRELLSLLNFAQFDVCLFTGYSVSMIKKLEIEGFKFVKTGKFEVKLACKSEKNDEYIQLSSTNQKLYDSNLRLLSSEGRYYFKQKQNV